MVPCLPTDCTSRQRPTWRVCFRFCVCLQRDVLVLLLRSLKKCTYAETDGNDTCWFSWKDVVSTGMCVIFFCLLINYLKPVTSKHQERQILIFIVIFQFLLHLLMSKFCFTKVSDCTVAYGSKLPIIQLISVKFSLAHFCKRVFANSKAPGTSK
jgi:hypothetical protein